LIDKNLDWKLFLNLFTDETKRNSLLQELLLKYIDIKDWKSTAADFSILLGKLFPDPWQYLPRLATIRWEEYAHLMNIHKDVPADTAELIARLDLFSEYQHKAVFINTFPIHAGLFFNSRKELLENLIKNLPQLPIAKWPEFFAVLNLSRENIFNNREELIDILVNYLPIQEWSNFLNVFDKQFDIKKHDLFKTSDELFAFMEKQTARENWYLLLTDFNTAQLNKLIANEEQMNDNSLRNLLTNLHYSEKNPQQQKCIAFCAEELYWRWREPQGIYIGKYSYYLRQAQNVSGKGIGVSAAQAFAVSDFPHKQQYWEVFLLQYCQKVKLNKESIEAAVFEKHMWFGDSVLCSMFKESLGIQPAPNAGFLGFWATAPATLPAMTEITVAPEADVQEESKKTIKMG
jgi:hypothetical protein